MKQVARVLNVFVSCVLLHKQEHAGESPLQRLVQLLDACI